MTKDVQESMALLAMTEQELKEFLSKPRLARLSTIDIEQPHIVPVWYLFDGKSIFVTTVKGSKKARNIEKNPNVALTIDECDGKIGDISYYINSKAVIIEGKAQLQEDKDAEMFRRIFQLYIGKENVENPMVQYIMSLPHYVIVIKPFKIKSWDFRKMLNK